tara:strand:- start:84 stop:482 length:399 start_codon:yes stop_codon:yes gene_type:complete
MVDGKDDSYRFQLKEGREVICQFRNTKCDFIDCEKILPHKGIVWNVNYSYFHITCYEKLMKMSNISITDDDPSSKKYAKILQDIIKTRIVNKLEPLKLDPSKLEIIDVLKMELAKGEITPEEFNEIKEHLEK